MPVKRTQDWRLGALSAVPSGLGLFIVGSHEDSQRPAATVGGYDTCKFGG